MAEPATFPADPAIPPRPARPPRPAISPTPAESTDPVNAAELSTGDLVTRITTQVSTLVRDELALARLELTQKGKKAGVGAGLFGGAGIAALYGVGALLTAAIAALALVLPVWASALVVAVVLFLAAGVVALLGKKNLSQATPAVPTEAVDGLKTDAQIVKEHAHR
ncbi:phage holin family protein [Cryptosporangium phraense]|uniref:Phage holin family protein n=1 Tax=Cryptosporangium phraense TaxID=2593070 RepID=A0A545AUZ8_9ACTN|nr:phage holin family protein [Cryptosporangium phraense]TQS45152.1 phage holin family protein [Cryptosporangium phraense]